MSYYQLFTSNNNISPSRLICRFSDEQEYNNYIVTFSKCPLIEMPIEVKKLKSNLVEYF